MIYRLRELSPSRAQALRSLSLLSRTHSACRPLWGIRHGQSRPTPVQQFNLQPGGDSLWLGKQPASSVSVPMTAQVGPTGRPSLPGKRTWAARWRPPRSRRLTPAARTFRIEQPRWWIRTEIACNFSGVPRPPRDRRQDGEGKRGGVRHRSRRCGIPGEGSHVGMFSRARTTWGGQNCWHARPNRVVVASSNGQNQLLAKWPVRIHATPTTTPPNQPYGAAGYTQPSPRKCLQPVPHVAQRRRSRYGCCGEGNRAGLPCFDTTAGGSGRLRHEPNVFREFAQAANRFSTSGTTFTIALGDGVVNNNRPRTAWGLPPSQKSIFEGRRASSRQ